MLFAGGVTPPNADLQSTEIYNIASGTFRAGPVMTTARSNHAAVTLPDNRVILIGGNPASALNTAEIFTPGVLPTHALVQVGSLTFLRTEAHAALLQDGRVLIAGGRTGDGGPNLTSAEIYDPATQTWTVTGSMVEPRRAAPMVTLKDGRVLVVGGEDVPNPNIPHKTLEIFDPGDPVLGVPGTFSLVMDGDPLDPQPLEMLEPEGRNAPLVTLLEDGRVLITGGGTEGKNLASAEIFDPNAPLGSQLTALPDMSRPRGGHTSTLLADGRRVLIAGGGTGAGFVQTAEIFDPDAIDPVLGVPGTFTLIADLMYATPIGAGATLLPDGRVFIVGGNQTVGEIFDPVSETFTPTTTAGAFRGLTSAILLSSELVAVEGHADIVELYDPDTDTFSVAAHSTIGVRHSGTATLLKNGNVLYASGNDGLAGGTGRTDAEELRPLVDITANVDPLATVGAGVTVEANATIEKNAVVGAGALIGANAKIEENAQVGAGSTIGSEATIHKGAVIGDNVVIGDRADVGEQVSIGDGSVIGADVKIEEGVQIGTNVTIGDNVTIKKNAVVGDGTTIGDAVTIEQGVQIGANVTIGNNVMISENAVITDGAVIPDGATVT